MSKLFGSVRFQMCVFFVPKNNGKKIFANFFLTIFTGRAKNMNVFRAKTVWKSLRRHQKKKKLRQNFLLGGPKFL